MKAIIQKDIVISLGSLGNIDVPLSLQTLPINQLRFDGQTVIDASQATQFFICDSGIKHVVQHEKSWQQLDCQFCDVVVNDGNTWRIQNAHDIYQAKYSEVDNTRRQLYAQISDPLYMESFRKQSNGLSSEAEEYKRQADAAVELIQTENPWPTPPTN